MPPPCWPRTCCIPAGSRPSGGSTGSCRFRTISLTPTIPNASWFLFPGYKTSWEEAQWILNALRGALNKRGQLAAVGYSNQGLDIDQVVIAVIEHVRARKLTKLYFYGHSFGGMVATQVAARLRELHGVEVEFILLDSSPYSRSDVLDESWFDGVVFLYESGFRIPIRAPRRLRAGGACHPQG